MALPKPITGLQHKALFPLEYAEFDGPYADATDCRAISVGLAQYDPREVSVKTIRWNEEFSRWIRGSEEIPAHRAIDLIIWLLTCRHGDLTGRSLSIPAETFENQNDVVTVSVPNEFSARDIDYVIDKLRTDPHIVGRLAKLADMVVALRQAGEI